MRGILYRLEDWWFNLTFFIRTGKFPPSSAQLYEMAQKYPPPDDYWDDFLCDENTQD